MKVYTVMGCSNHCEAYMHERDTEDAMLPYRPLVEDSYVHLPDHQAALAAKDAAHELEIQRWMGVYATQTAAILEWEARVKAKDAALAELLEAMTKARACFHQEAADDILDEAIAKHRPEEGADNAR